jgi:glycosyltransferase involved in cell wall biosynthesis
MRVLMLSWEFPPHTIGGLARHVAEIAPALAAHGVDLHLLTPLVGDAPATEQIARRLTVHRVAGTHFSDDAPLVTRVQRANADLQAAAMALHREVGGFELIHNHDWLTACCSVPLAHALGRPLVATIHSLERGRMSGYLPTEQSVAINGMEVWLAHEAQRIITVSRFMAQHLQDALGVPPSKIDVIYNGVTLPHGEAAQPRLLDAQRRSIRQHYAPNDERLICYVGRLVYEKGAQTLLAALPQVRERIANVKLVIAGTGPMAEQLQHQVAANGLADHVVFAGYISDAERNEVYAAADAAVFPSLYEPFGIVALEAMSFGCPVVVSKTGGLAEIVEGHETGIVVEPGNPGSLAWGILHTLEHPKWAAARATNALRDLATTYSWRCIAEHTIATYRHVLAQWRDDAQAPLADPRRPARRATNGANRSGEYARG